MPAVRLYSPRAACETKVKQISVRQKYPNRFVVYVRKKEGMKRKALCFSHLEQTAGVKKETCDAIKLSGAATRLEKKIIKRKMAFSNFILAQLSCVALTKATVVAQRVTECCRTAQLNGFPGNRLFPCR